MKGKTMIYTQKDLLRRILETKAVSIWNHKTGPIFWYAASVPGPFYVNTELVIGPELSKTLLKGITAIVEETKDGKARAEKLESLILAAYEKDEIFKSLIETLAARIKTEFAAGSFTALSGGERRDWLFSLPVARLLGVKHVYLFKNGDFYCDQPIKQGEVALHVSDLINNAASYFDNWLPILQKAGLSCVGTVCVTSRGTNGVDRLKASGVKVVALNSVDVSFFEQSRDSGLIDDAVLEELKLFFRSAKEWASQYVMEKPELFNVPAIDEKSFERLQTFFSKDPWELRKTHEAFFASMSAAIAQRLKKAS